MLCHASSWFGVYKVQWHYNDVIMTTMASQITSLTTVYSTVYSGTDKKTSKLRVTGLCAGNSPATSEFPAERASNAENVTIWWRHRVFYVLHKPNRQKVLQCHKEKVTSASPEIDIHGCYSLVKNRRCANWPVQNNLRNWHHDASTLRLRNVTDQLWWRHNIKSVKTVLSDNDEISDR